VYRRKTKDQYTHDEDRIAVTKHGGQHWLKDSKKMLDANPSLQMIFAKQKRLADRQMNEAKTQK